MKIINKTGFTLNYVVVPSSTSLSDAGKYGYIVASGTVNANSTSSFSPNAGTNCGVYIGRQVASQDSTISVSFEET